MERREFLKFLPGALVGLLLGGRLLRSDPTTILTTTNTVPPQAVIDLAGTGEALRVTGVEHGRLTVERGFLFGGSRG